MLKDKITLRHFKTLDSQLLIEYLNDDKVTKYITNAISKPYSEVDALWWINEGSTINHAMAIEYNGHFIGCISANMGIFEYSHSAEIGYWLGQKFWNRGITTEAVKKYCELLYSTTDLTRLYISVVSENVASLRVLEKNGFSQEGYLKQASFKNGVYFDEILLSKIRTKIL